MIAYEGSDYKCELKGLRPGTSYRARVCATNLFGRGPFSDWTVVATNATTPAPPLRPFVTQMGLGWMTVAWPPSMETGGSEIIAYTLELDDSGGDGFLVKVNGLIDSYTLQGAIPNHIYKFRLKAQNSVGASLYSPVLEVPGCCGPPGAPGHVQVTACCHVTPQPSCIRFSSGAAHVS